MALFESFIVALQAIWTNKLRALLTMLGVIIGVSSVLIMIAIVQGLRQSIINQLSGGGANLVFAQYAPWSESVNKGTPGFTLEDLDAIKRRCSLVDDVSPIDSVGVEAHYGGITKSVQISGVLTEYADLQNLQLSDGRWLSEADESTYGKACVIGSELKTKLFGNQSVLGKQLLCRSNGSDVALNIVGVLEQKDRGADGVDFSEGVFAPLRSVQLRFDANTLITQFTAHSTDISETETAADQIWAVIKDRHPLNYKAFTVDTMAGLLKEIDVIIGGLQIVLGGVAGLSLLTGGIGIMNIMLVSVTERTREIGIRKAVGATQGAILAQFVVEAMVVSGTGGLIGVAIGTSVSWAIDHFFHKTLPTFVPFWADLLGFGFSVAVGLFFGIFPAYRASKLDPIQALRYE